MVEPKTPETNPGIRGQLDVLPHDGLLRAMRDKGGVPVKLVRQAGITGGRALEGGPGPGYLGLEWLKTDDQAELTGVEVSADMIALAQRNAALYGLQKRATYLTADPAKLPFEGASFDGVFTNGSLHPCKDPEAVLGEVDRVLKPGGSYCIVGLRRDMPAPVRWLMRAAVPSEEARALLATWIRASYTRSELQTLIRRTPLRGAWVVSNLMGWMVLGKKG
jgi:ubiquinone/menaquinone biosynthesis C-methylase UbiE